MPAREYKTWADDEEDLLYKVAELVDDFSIANKRAPASVFRRLRKILEDDRVLKVVREERKAQKYYS